MLSFVDIQGALDLVVGGVGVVELTRRPGGDQRKRRGRLVGAPLPDKVRANLWVVVDVDEIFGVAAKGLYRVGQARPSFELGDVNSP
jgi:hypothetical protein